MFRSVSVPSKAISARVQRTKKAGIPSCSRLEWTHEAGLLMLDNIDGQAQSIGDRPVGVCADQRDLIVSPLAARRQAECLGILPHLS